MQDMINFFRVVEIIHTTRGKERQEMVKWPSLVGIHIDGSGWMATNSSTTPLGLVGWRLLLGTLKIIGQLTSDKAIFPKTIGFIGFRCGFGKATFMWSIWHKAVTINERGASSPRFLFSSNMIFLVFRTLASR